MPIERPTNNLYRIKELNIGQSGEDYYLSMNYGKAHACVLCICRTRLITAEDLSLGEDDLDHLYSGGKLEFEDYTLHGISGRQLTALSQYRNKDLLKPPVYVQAWSMVAADQNRKILYIPENPEDQMFLVPVYYQMNLSNGNLTIHMEEAEGYKDGDLMYQVENRLPVPIPKSWLDRPIPLRFPQEKIRVFPESSVEKNYIPAKN